MRSIVLVTGYGGSLQTFFLGSKRMTDCVVTEDSQTKGVITPWHHSEPLSICIRAGRVGQLMGIPTPAGLCKVSVTYPHHTVTAELPVSNLKF